MGHHFVPQAYLRAFQDPLQPGFIWTLLRGQAVPRLLPIKEVAQSSGFYDPGTEVDLARLVEGPANPVLEKLRERQVLDPAERFSLGVYIATMLHRVPKKRERGERLLKPALDSTVEGIRQDIHRSAESGTLPPELVARQLRELDEVYAKYSRNPPGQVMAQLRNPRPTATVVRAVLGMTWRILVPPASEYFITSDNPAFFHGSYGIGMPEAEIRFPVSPTLALHGTWQPDPHGSLAVHAVPRDWVREFNRSLASDASRLLFSHRNASWLETLLHRKKPYLFRLVWT